MVARINPNMTPNHLNLNLASIYPAIGQVMAITRFDTEDIIRLLAKKRKKGAVC